MICRKPLVIWGVMFASCILWAAGSALVYLAYLLYKVG